MAARATWETNVTAFRWRIALFGSLRLLKVDQEEQQEDRLTADQLQEQQKERQEEQVVCTFSPSKTGSLLAYLVCQTHRAHTRQELAERFWPEADNSIGRTRLRQHLTTLRQQLEPKDVPPGSVLRTSREEVVLIPAAFTTDVAEFEEALRRAEQTTDADKCAALLERAIGLYRGELLSGYYDHWILTERERLKARLCDALRQRAAGCEKAKETARALDYLQRLVAADPLREESYLRLIRLLIADNQTAAARRQYKTLERLLKTELDDMPSAAARALIAGLSAEMLLDSQKGNTNSLLASAGLQLPDASYAVIPAEALLPAVVPESAPVLLTTKPQPDPSLVTASESLSFTSPSDEQPISVPAVASAPDEPSLSTPSLHPVPAPVPRNHPRPLRKARQADITTNIRTSNQIEITPAQRRSRRSLALVGVSVVSLLAVLFLGQRWLQKPDTNPAHHNFSPAAKQNKTPDELWIRRYEPKHGDKDSEPVAMTVDRAGNIYVTGFIQTEKEDVNYITLKYAPDGRILWERQYNGTGNDMDKAGSIAVDDEGNVYVTGGSLGKTGQGPDDHNEQDIVTIKYDANGKQIGIIRYDGPGHGCDGPSRIALDGKGHVYVFGSDWSGLQSNGTDGHGCVLIQYDKNLKQNWIQRYFDQNGAPAYGSAMTIDPEGMVYATGRSGNGLFTLKYNTAGTRLGWDKRAMSPDMVSQPLHVLSGEEGSVYVVSQIIKRTENPPTETFAIQVVKYDRAFHLQREYIYWNAAPNFRGTGAAVYGRLYITGTSQGADRAFQQGLLSIREDGADVHFNPFFGASRGEQHGNDLTIDHRRLIHITGQDHFADTETASPLVSNNEITTTTYDNTGGLYRIHRYAGSDLLRNDKGGRVIVADDQNNILVAGQTFDGKFNDLVLIKYPP